jgi:hypothetical protein
VRTTKRQKETQKTAHQKAVVEAMVEALVRLEEKLLVLQTLDEFDRKILAIIASALNMVRGVGKSHSADLEVQS